MVAAKWYPADPLTFESCLEIAEATVLKRPYDDGAGQQPVLRWPQGRSRVRDAGRARSAQAASCAVLEDRKVRRRRATFVGGVGHVRRARWPQRHDRRGDASHRDRTSTPNAITSWRRVKATGDDRKRNTTFPIFTKCARARMAAATLGTRMAHWTSRRRSRSRSPSACGAAGQGIDRRGRSAENRLLAFALPGWPPDPPAMPAHASQDPAMSALAPQPITMQNGRLTTPDCPDHPVHRGRRHRPGYLAGQRRGVRRRGREGLRRQAARSSGRKCSPARRRSTRPATGCPTKRSTPSAPTSSASRAR